MPKSPFRSALVVALFILFAVPTAVAAPAFTVKAADGVALVLELTGAPGLDESAVRSKVKGALVRFAIAGVRVTKGSLPADADWVSSITAFPDTKGRLSYVSIKLAAAAAPDLGERIAVEGTADGLRFTIPGPGATTAVPVAVAPIPLPIPAPAAPAPTLPAPSATAPPAAAPTAANTVRIQVPSVGGSVREEIGALGEALFTSLEKRPGIHRVAIMPFEALDEDSKSLQLGPLSAELLRTRAAKHPQLLQVERSRLDDIAGELQRAERGDLSTDTAASVGKLLGATEVIVGTVAAAGAEFVLTARAVDAETGQVVAAAEQSLPRADTITLSEDLIDTKSRWGAMARSGVLPGWGQVYNGDTVRGVVYGGLFALAAAGAITSTVLGAQAEDEYNKNRPDTVDERSVANDHYNRANYLLIAVGAIWAINLADAYISGSDQRILSVGGETSVVGRTTPMGLGFTF